MRAFLFSAPEKAPLDCGLLGGTAAIAAALAALASFTALAALLAPFSAAGFTHGGCASDVFIKRQPAVLVGVKTVEEGLGALSIALGGHKFFFRKVAFGLFIVLSKETLGTLAQGIRPRCGPALALGFPCGSLFGNGLFFGRQVRQKTDSEAGNNKIG